MLAALQRVEADEDLSREANEALARAPTPRDENLLDVDAVVARRARARNESVPADVAGRVTAHLAAIEETLARFDAPRPG